MQDDGIAYLRLTEFNAVSGDKVQAALKELLGQNPVGLIFDLRGNPGGYLHMAVQVAGEFLPRNTLILTEEQRDQPDQEFRVRGRGLATEIPLVVLVDGGSASASEIVAGAIQDQGAGSLVGEMTYGKGSVQQTHTLRDGSSLRVTIARWLLPSGRNLDRDGIAPDIEVGADARGFRGPARPADGCCARHFAGTDALIWQTRRQRTRTRGGNRNIASNRKAFHDYAIDDRFEAALCWWARR